MINMRNQRQEPITINVDFDGTCVSHEFPHVGNDIGAVSVLKDLVAAGHKLILFTMRSDRHNENTLNDAVLWFKNNNIPLYGVQSNPEQRSWTNSPKSYADLMIDDSALGCPVKRDLAISDRPFVDWVAVRETLTEQGIL